MQIVPESITSKDDNVTVLNFMGQGHRTIWVVSVRAALEREIKTVLLFLGFEINHEFLGIGVSASYAHEPLFTPENHVA